MLFFALLSGLPTPDTRVLHYVPSFAKEPVLKLDAVRNVLVAPFNRILDLFQFSEEWKLFSSAVNVRFLMSVEGRTADDAAWEVLYRPHHPQHALFDEVLEYRRVRGNWNPSRRGPSAGYEGFVTWVARRVFAANPAYTAVRVRMEEIEVLSEGRGYAQTGRFFHERVRARSEVPPWP